MLQSLTVPLIEAWACHALLAVWGKIMQQCVVELQWIISQASFAFVLADAKGYTSNQVTLIGMTQIALRQSKICNNYNNIEQNPNPTLIPIHTVHRTAAVYIIRS